MDKSAESHERTATSFEAAALPGDRHDSYRERAARHREFAAEDRQMAERLRRMADSDATWASWTTATWDR